SGTQAFPRNIGDEKGGAVVAERKNIEVIAADGKAGEIASCDGEMRIIAEVARQECLLNVAGDVDFLLHALAFALACYQAGVVQNAGGLIGKRVEQLAIELGKCGRAARIEIQHAEKLPTFHVDD